MLILRKLGEQNSTKRKIKEGVHFKNGQHGTFYIIVVIF